jgi:signal transduction histidine kinase
MSMRVRLTLIASATTAVVVFVAGLLLIRSAEDSQLDRLKSLADESVAIAAERLEGGAAWQEALADLPTVVFISQDGGDCVASNPAGGQLVFRCAGQATPTFDVMTSAPAPSPGAPGVVAVRGELGAIESVTRNVDSAAYGPLVISSAAPASTVARGLESVGWIVWVLFPGMVAVVALLTWWLAGFALRPVEAIRAEAEAIEAASIHRRVPEPATNDEIGRLARTMNAMLDRLEQASTTRRRFVSDASHELRSPVAAIRTDVEVALAEGERADWPATARAVLTEEARLDALIGDLLLLAASDESSASTTATARVDLETLVVEEAARRRRLDVSVDVATDDPDTLAVSGDRAQLQRVLANLLDNACRHGERRVDVTLRSVGDIVIIDVDDDGPGIAPADRQRVFERFARLDEGRDRDRGGAGLGLAVVDAIVRSHGGSVSIGDSPLGGARFVVEIPAAA